MEALGDTRGFSQCVLGLEVCADDAPCPVHTLFREVRQRLLTELQTVTVADIVMVITQPPSESMGDSARGTEGE
jgi:DNA-binding IscR family transcriptional regulator